MNQLVQQRQEINLFTLEFRRDEQAFSFQFIARSCGVLLLVLLLVEGLTAWRWWNQQQLLVELQQEQQLVDARLTQLKQSRPLSQRKQLETTLASLQDAVLRRQELQKIMGGQKFGNFDGFSPHLVGLARQANKDISLTQIDLLQGGKTLQLQGWTRQPESVPRYLQDLRLEKIFEEVRFGVLSIEQDPEQNHKLKFWLGKSGDNPT